MNNTVKHFSVYRGDDEVGWFTCVELDKQLKKGRLKKDDYIWFEDKQEWYTLDVFQQTIRPRYSGVEAGEVSGQGFLDSFLEECKEFSSHCLDCFKLCLFVHCIIFAQVIKHNDFSSKGHIIIQSFIFLFTAFFGIVAFIHYTKNKPVKKRNKNMSTAQGTIIIIILLASMGAPYWSALKPKAKWDYKTVAYVATETLGYSSADMNPKEIMQELLAASLREEGANGWELVDTFLEQETKFADLGDESLIAHIKENTRARRLVCIFKRPLQSDLKEIVLSLK